MPSGAKKRKAAKKKHDYPSVYDHFQGGSEVKQHDDKDSDTGEDNHSYQNSTDGEEEENETEKNISSPPSEEALKIEDREKPSMLEDDADVRVDREFQIEDRTRNKDDGSSWEKSGGRSSSHNRSDEEFHSIKNGEAVKDTAPVVDSGSGGEYFSGIPVENVGSAVGEDVADSKVKHSAADDGEDTSNHGKKVAADRVSKADNGRASSNVEPVETEEKGQDPREDKIGISALPLNRKEESIEKNGTSDPKKSVTPRNDDTVASDNAVGREKDSGAKEPVLLPAYRPVETASWKNCCGLFEVFKGSRDN